MDKLSKTFLTISAVLSFIAAGALFITSICLVGFGVGFFSMISEQSEPGGAGYLAGMIAGAIVCLYFGIMAIVCGAMSNGARRNFNKRSLILAIVFSALSCTWIGVAGGVVGLIAVDKAARRDRQNNIVDAK